MKKYIISLTIIIAAAAVVVGATGAFFSDTETSTGNIFAAGSLDLKVDNTCHYYQDGVDVGCYKGDDPTGGQGPVVETSWAETDLVPGVHKFFYFDDIKPGDYGEDTISLHVYDNDAWGWFTIKNLSDADNSCTEPEEGDEPECKDDDNGELDEAILFTAWLDEGSRPGFQNGGTGDDDPGEGDNILNYDERPIFEGDSINELGPFDLSEVLSAAYGVCNSLTTQSPDGHNNYGDCHGLAADGRMVGSTTYYIGLSWILPLATDNKVQTDSFGGDMEFVVVQHRNNPDKVGGPEVIESIRVTGNLLAFSSTGWGGHSCPANHTVVGGGVLGATELIEGQGMAKSGVTVAGSTYPDYPHYSYTSPGEGWVVKNGVVGQTMTVYADCLPNQI